MPEFLLWEERHITKTRFISIMNRVKRMFQEVFIMFEKKVYSVLPVMVDTFPGRKMENSSIDRKNHTSPTMLRNAIQVRKFSDCNYTFKKLPF